MTIGRIRKIALVQTTHLGTARPEIGLGNGFLRNYLSAYARGEYEVDVFESNDFMDNVLNHAGDYDLVALSTVSYLYDVARRIARDIKDNFGDRVTTIVGGVHPTSAPETMSNDFDYGAVGEGEQTFLELVEALDRGAADEEVLDIPGIVGIRNGKLVKRSPRLFIDDLEKIPFPDREMFNKYRAVPSLITARGCPYKCDFCTNRVIWTRAVRKPRAERVADELADIVAKIDDVRVIVFRDDIVFIKEGYVREVYKVMEEKYPDLLTIPKVGYAHVNTLRPKFARLLLDLGLNKILCGFESASPRILHLLKGGSVTVEQNRKAIGICNDLGLDIAGNFIIGTPDEEEEDVIATYEFIMEHLRSGAVKNISTSILTPFPGERYWDIFMEHEGGDLSMFDWSRLNEGGFSTFYEDRKGQTTVRAWWEERKAGSKIYLGRIPEDRFVDIMQRYEPEIAELQREYLAKDRKY
jgi:anaerobic magnesium-protoporphyrin IX monomethyl ester cyclase